MLLHLAHFQQVKCFVVLFIVQSSLLTYCLLKIGPILRNLHLKLSDTVLKLQFSQMLNLKLLHSCFNLVFSGHLELLVLLLRKARRHERLLLLTALGGHRKLPLVVHAFQFAFKGGNLLFGLH